jgi:hypothetical protein
MPVHREDEMKSVLVPVSEMAAETQRVAEREAWAMSTPTISFGTSRTATVTQQHVSYSGKTHRG